MDLPELQFVGGERLPESPSVVGFGRIDVDFVPGHEQWRLVAVAALGAVPFALKVVAHSVGRRLDDHHRERRHGYGPGNGTHGLVGRSRGGIVPEGHLREVCHGVVGAAHGVLIARRGGGDVAATPGNGAHLALPLVRGEAELPLHLFPAFRARGGLRAVIILIIVAAFIQPQLLRILGESL